MNFQNPIINLIDTLEVALEDYTVQVSNFRDFAIKRTFQCQERVVNIKIRHSHVLKIINYKDMILSVGLISQKLHSPPFSLRF